MSSSYFSILPSLARKQINVILRVKCKKCKSSSKYKIQVPYCNPMAIANLVTAFSPPVDPAAAQALMFTSLAVNESCYNPCNPCNSSYQSPCDKSSSSSSSSSSSESSDFDDERVCKRKKDEDKTHRRKHHKKSRDCKKKKKHHRDSAYFPAVGGGCGYGYGGGYPSTYGGGCPTPIAPSHCGGIIPYYSLYEPTTGLITIPPQGNGTYLLTSNLTVTGATGNGTTVLHLNVVVNGSIVATFNYSGSDGTFYINYRVQMQDSNTASFTISQSGAATPASVMITSGEIDIVRLY